MLDITQEAYNLTVGSKQFKKPTLSKLGPMLGVLITENTYFKCMIFDFFLSDRNSY